ncbi:MAG: 16S rRNA (cytosine(1402)-N(4))-methyltransferase [Armatimonadetes bacterium CG2_30_59_28]|nr:MAG: 16S rRNA (cytosine(1402)-N(4))-methyltransferase [Armatimonadetes bacterium CG2_30_59_28]PIU61949.1 MAG: 16S rRNA (cytosine(1402)-N(4))-methyltransferase RsmH [Armatimonadetes bacterium CG07_land_8_20_14_0_80_59_28]PIY42673.1 MAG: 16S rRNA (cytosine(1402)-N(4))-methyltransferase RsmH [Armatimonadetes bacterium CG_4_10_14_3_um_filter_59_10]PJB64891.1 MAG: 16S rRNA (cytosine(1402)-N(4))-methyltransferase RsmH [Armatimonadetes bacterium CG_4_9_14_3_um_filter_58_7]
METPRHHVPVMVNDCIELLDARTLRTSVFVDMTVGTGGHTEALLQSAPRSTVIGIDRDESALELVSEQLKDYSDRLVLVYGDFRDVDTHLENLGIEKADGLLIDAGMSLWQVDTPGRGFSFRFDGPLDMRYDRSQSMDAEHLVNTLTAEQLSELLFQAGERGWARHIAANIIAHRRRRRITNTQELVAIVEASVPAKYRAKCRTHPATKTLAAIRQAVNSEMDAIETGLTNAARIAASHARIVVITYSSREDRIAKTTLRRLSTHYEETKDRFVDTVAPGPPFSINGEARLASPTPRPLVRILTKRPLTPDLTEQRANPRSRSAKLRAAERIGEVNE